MPRPIQTLHLADVLTRIFRLSGKAKLEADEQVIPTVNIAVDGAPYVADGRHYFAAEISSVAAVGFISHCAVVNPVAGGGLLVVDRIVAYSTGMPVRVGFSRASLAAGSRVFSRMVPFRPGVAAGRQLPPLVRQNNSGGPFGTTLLQIPPIFTTAGGMLTFDIPGPFVLPGLVDEEELIVRTATTDTPVNVNFTGRWYPGIKASELL